MAVPPSSAAKPMRSSMKALTAVATAVNAASSFVSLTPM